MKTDLVSKLTDAFLQWRLPKSVCADGCTTTTEWPHPRYGTNLLTAVEAEQMIREVVLPIVKMETEKSLKPVIDYVQAVKNHVPIGVVVSALQVRDALDGANIEVSLGRAKP